MHELSIALSIIEGVEEELARHPDSQVIAVHLRLGPLCGVVKEALLFSYDLACEGTRLEGATLQIEEMASGSELEVFALELEDKSASVTAPAASPR
jgi:hydrogenase nickel incorporation protein HypA/HybF